MEHNFPHPPMFKELGSYKHILVTGPQRCGTRICTKMIAHDTGHRFVDEVEIHVDSLYSLAVLKTQAEESMVVQCPGLAYCIDTFSTPDTAIIFMMRPITEIIASQERVNWKWEWLEKTHYQDSDGPVSEIKYRHWEQQKKRIHNPIEIEYNSLKQHPLWIPKEKRLQFKATQTEVHEKQ